MNTTVITNIEASKSILGKRLQRQQLEIYVGQHVKSICFSSRKQNDTLKLAGLLTCPGNAAFPSNDSGKMTFLFTGLTAAGTVPDLHRIPY